MALERLPVARALVPEQFAALVEERLVVEQDRLVVVADLVSEVAEQRPVRLAQTHSEGLAVCIQGFGQVDRDDAVRVADRHSLA